jgi:predicted Mrr-cat superfamily restriction endonuclease
VVAYRDPLGPPCIRTQVKHRTAPVSRDAIASLRGVLRGEETALFVSLSGFTPEAVREAQGEKPIRLIDGDAFVALWIRHYDALTDAARDMMRLRAVHFLERECYDRPRMLDTISAAAACRSAR